jgi:glycosyltransferase involved in cell wall biosynthesis
LQWLSVIIPVFNEEDLLGRLLDKVLEAPLSIAKEIIVVDDGSTDRSCREVERWMAEHPKAPLRLFRKSNGGKGSAVRLGLEHSTGNIVIIQDADLEYDPRDYQACIDPILKGEASVVYGSRELGGKNSQRSHLTFYLGGLLVTFVTNLLFHSRLTDEPTCYKTFRGTLIRALPFEGNGFEWEPEITAKLLRLGFRIQEVPIRYNPRSIAEGKKIAWRDGLKALAVLLKFRLRPLGTLKTVLSAPPASRSPDVLP